MLYGNGTELSLGLDPVPPAPWSDVNLHSLVVSILPFKSFFILTPSGHGVHRTAAHILDKLLWRPGSQALAEPPGERFACSPGLGGFIPFAQSPLSALHCSEGHSPEAGLPVLRGWCPTHRRMRRRC